MYPYKVFNHVEISRKKVFGGCKSQKCFIGDQNAGRGDRMVEAQRCSERHGLAGPEGHSANLEAWR